jgi:hypothetical protein
MVYITLNDELEGSGCGLISPGIGGTEENDVNPPSE